MSYKPHKQNANIIAS